MSKPKFTICVLLYGNYPTLAERCLRSITETVAAEDLELRVGLNQVVPLVADWVKSWLPPECIWESKENRHKYPMMREMIHGVRPIETPYTMWFDDDSYLDGFQLTAGHDQVHWLHTVEQCMEDADMIGSIYSMHWSGNQRDFVKAQPWYAGKDPADQPKIRFATGGWWTMRTPLLYRYDYPWPTLDHRGGDIMLGEMCRQQSLRLRHFNTGLHINADKDGKESKSQRRGFDQTPIGVDFDPGVADTLHRATVLRI